MASRPCAQGAMGGGANSRSERPLSDTRERVGGDQYKDIYFDFLAWLDETGRQPFTGMHWDGWKVNLVVPIAGHPHTNLQVYINTSKTTLSHRIIVNLVCNQVLTASWCRIFLTAVIS